LPVNRELIIKLGDNGHKGIGKQNFLRFLRTKNIDDLDDLDDLDDIDERFLKWLICC